MPTTYAIPDGRVAMAATLYTGTLLSNAVSNAVNGISFQPDWVWLKSRSAATSHKLTDSVRGVTKGLVSNSTAAETTDVQGLTSFSSGGFTVGTNTDYNNLAATYVAWQWKANGAAVSNTDGSITSSVSANTTAGFSVVSATTTSAAGTIGHGLGVAPSLIIGVNRAAPNGWWVYHASRGATKYLVLNTTAAEVTAASVWNNTEPTSTVFSQGSGGWNNAATAIFYCFAPVAGYSAFGSYTGNGSADGPFVYLGFRPRWIMIKSSTAVTSWEIWDTSRDTSNTMNAELYPNLSIAETNATTNNRPIDSVSNGFKIRGTDAQVNTSGQTYIYACFAENPFKYANAR